MALLSLPTLSAAESTAFLLLALLAGPTLSQQGSAPARKLSQQEIDEYCRNFTTGNQRELEFYSPNYPEEYPPEIVCNRVLTAPPGYFVQVGAQRAETDYGNKDRATLICVRAKRLGAAMAFKKHSERL